MRKCVVLLFGIVLLFLVCCKTKNNNAIYSSEVALKSGFESSAIMDYLRDDAETIDFDALKGRTDTMTGFISDYRLVALETNELSLVGQICDIIATDEFIYINDMLTNGCILIFDIDGKFVKRIKQGQAPGDLVNLTSISYDYDNDELLAKQSFAISVFSKNGEYKYSIPTSFDNEEMLCFNNELIYCQRREINSHLGEYANYKMLVTDKTGMLKKASLPNSITTVFTNSKHMQQTKDGIYFSKDFNDTIWFYDGNNVRAKYVLGFTPQLDPQKVNGTKSNEFRQYSTSCDAYFYVGEHVETDSVHFFLMNNWHTKRSIIAYRDKFSKKMVGGTETMFRIDKYPKMSMPCAAKGCFFVSYIVPENTPSLMQCLDSPCLSEHDKRIVRNAKDEDNPIIAFYKINPNARQF